jgi:ATP sulfurylase
LKSIKYAKEMKEGYDKELTEAKKLKNHEVFMSKHGTVMARYLNKEMWDEYKDMKCEKNIPFKDIIYPGVKIFDNEKWTLCASSLSCYKIYHKLFEKYLFANHPYYRSNVNHPELISC